MVTVINHNSSKEQISEAIKKAKSKHGFNAYKYCGVIKLKETPEAIQKKMRDEWK